MKALLLVLLQCAALFAYGCACPEAHDVYTDASVDVEALSVAADEECPAGRANVREYFADYPYYCNWFDDDFAVCTAAIYIPEHPYESFFAMITGSDGTYDVWTRDLCVGGSTCEAYHKWKRATCNCFDVFEGACKVSSYAPPWGF